MTMTERLLEATKEIWDGYNETPFVKGIADGSLDHEKFKYYMIQDYLYLLDYTKVFSIGTAKAKNLDAMRLFAGYTHSSPCFRRSRGSRVSVFRGSGCSPYPSSPAGR